MGGEGSGGAYGGAVDGTVVEGVRLRDDPAWRRGAVALAATVVALLAALGVGVLWAVFVQTEHGQEVDRAVLWGALYGQSHVWDIAERVLQVVSVGMIAGVLLAAVVIAIVRRRWELAVQAAVVMIGANVTTRVLKFELLGRPDNGIDTGSPLNSLPSGHTTAAMSISVVLLLVVSARARPWVAVLGAGYTTATGVSTLVGWWHRPSDVVAAVLVVLAWTAATCALTVMWPAARRDERLDERPPARAALGAVTGGLVVIGLVAGAIAALTLSNTFTDVPAQGDRAGLLAAYGGAVAGILMAATLSFAIILVLRHAAARRVLPA